MTVTTVDALLAVGCNVAFGLAAWAVGWVGGRGFLAGVFSGSIIFCAFGASGWSLLVLFFCGGSLATRYGYSRKAALGIAQRARGARGAREAFANTAVALGVAVAALFLPTPLLPFAYAGAVATAFADTAASELGSLWGRHTVLPLTLRRVAPGTEGAISFEGTLVGAAAAAALAALAFLTRFLPAAAIVIVPAAAVLASYVESVLGSSERLVRLRQNEALNLLNTALGASLSALLAGVFGAGAAS